MYVSWQSNDLGDIFLMVFAKKMYGLNYEQKNLESFFENFEKMPKMLILRKVVRSK